MWWGAWLRVDLAVLSKLFFFPITMVLIWKLYVLHTPNWHGIHFLFFSFTETWYQLQITFSFVKVYDTLILKSIAHVKNS